MLAGNICADSHESQIMLSWSWLWIRNRIKLKGRIRIRIRINVISWIRVRIIVISWIRISINLEMTSQNVWKMSLFEHFFKVLSLYLEARIQIRIHVPSQWKVDSDPDPQHWLRSWSWTWLIGQVLMSALVGSCWSGGNSVWRMAKADGPPPSPQTVQFLHSAGTGGHLPSSLKRRVHGGGGGGSLPWDVWLVRSRGRLYPLRPPLDPPPVQLCKNETKFLCSNSDAKADF